MQEIIAAVDDHEREALALLEQLVNVDSGTYDKAGVDHVGAILAERVATLGFSVETIAQNIVGNHLVCRKPGRSDRRILFIGHMDTVFPAGTVAKRPFRIEGSRAFGPGVVDMKGGIVCLLTALTALKQTRSPAWDAMDMTIVFNSDEEVLSTTSHPIIAREAQRARTVCVFEPARPGGEYVIQRKGVGKYVLTVHGRAAHAGAQPERGRSAIVELAHKIVALHAMNDPSTGVTVNVGVIRGGERSNVIAEQAQAEIDLRVPDNATLVHVAARFQEIAATNTIPDTTAELSGGVTFPPMVQTPAARTLFAALQEAGRTLGLELRGIPTGGGSDGNHASQFAPTLDGMGPQGSEAHSDREFMEVPTLAERAKVTALFLARWPEIISTINF